MKSAREVFLDEIPSLCKAFYFLRGLSIDQTANGAKRSVHVLPSLEQIFS